MAHILNCICQQLARELKVWAGLLHPNILELVGFYLSDTLETAWLLSPYEPEGNLANFLEKKRPSQGRKVELVSLSATSVNDDINLLEPGV